MGRKLGAVPIWAGEAGSPSKTMWPGPRPTCTPSFILIHLTVWAQYTIVTDWTGQDRQTDRQTDRQQSDSIGRSVLQTVAQKHILPIHRPMTKPFCACGECLQLLKKSAVYEIMSIKSLPFSSKTITDIYTGVDGEDADENGRQQQANDCH